VPVLVAAKIMLPEPEIRPVKVVEVPAVLLIVNVPAPKVIAPVVLLVRSAIDATVSL
jgi:hypothetical protein